MGLRRVSPPIGPGPGRTPGRFCLVEGFRGTAEDMAARRARCNCEECRKTKDFFSKLETGEIELVVSKKEEPPPIPVTSEDSHKKEIERLTKEKYDLLSRIAELQSEINAWKRKYEFALSLTP